MNFADITNNRHIQSMSPQRQLTIAITLPTTPTDTIYSQCIIQMHQLPANGLSADNIVCNKPEVDQLLFKHNNELDYQYVLICYLIASDT